MHMREAYESGDPYTQVAAMAGMWTADMAAGQARQIRKLFKSLVLGRMYGMSLTTFRRRSGVPYGQAVRVWQFFDRQFAKFRDWQDRIVAQARRREWITTRYGWKARVYPMTGTTTLLNWAIQAGASDVLRVAVILLAEAGIDLLTTVHDSLLASLPVGQVEERQAELGRIMREAAEIAVGLPIRVDMHVVRPGERLLTAETQPEWERVMALLEQGAFNP
jgi:DNA polymerase I-like protein with 3'-5' exonuclease and polymerase domains